MHCKESENNIKNLQYPLIDDGKFTGFQHPNPKYLWAWQTQNTYEFIWIPYLHLLRLLQKLEIPEATIFDCAKASTLE